MADYTEVTNESWFSRLGGAMKGILMGLVLIAISFVLIFWNEGRAVKRHKALQEGGSKVVSVLVDKVDSANEGQLVHLSGQAQTQEVLTDPVFGVGAKALKLQRHVEIFLWQESVQTEQKKKLGGGTETKKSYSYSRDWSERLIDSSKFKVQEGHSNPQSTPYSSERWQAEKVDLGAFFLSTSLITKITSSQELVVEAGSKVPDAIKDQVKVFSPGFYVGESPADPKIGDSRVSFKSVKPLEVSVVSQQEGNSFVPYQATNGRDVELLQAGRHTAEQMFEKAKNDNVVLSWILRVGGFILMMVGFNMVFKVASVLADVLPIAGNIVGAGTGIIAFLLAACLSLMTMAVAWIFYRPILGVSLLFVGIVFIVFVVKKLNGETATKDRGA